MKHDALMNMVDDLLYGNNGADSMIQRLKARVNSLVRSGAVDLEKFKDKDYMLPKVLLHQAMNDVMSDYRPVSREGHVIAERLEVV